MGIIITIILGAFVGWLASIIMNRDAEQGAIGNIVVGVIGALIGSFVSAILTGRDRAALAFDLSSLFWATIGAVALCAIINLVTKGETR